MLIKLVTAIDGVGKPFFYNFEYWRFRVAGALLRVFKSTGSDGEKLKAYRKFRKLILMHQRRTLTDAYNGNLEEERQPVNNAIRGMVTMLANAEQQIDANPSADAYLHSIQDGIRNLLPQLRELIAEDDSLATQFFNMDYVIRNIDNLSVEAIRQQAFGGNVYNCMAFLRIWFRLQRSVFGAMREIGRLGELTYRRSLGGLQELPPQAMRVKGTFMQPSEPVNIKLQRLQRVDATIDEVIAIFESYLGDAVPDLSTDPSIETHVIRELDPLDRQMYGIAGNRDHLLLIRRVVRIVSSLDTRDRAVQPSIKKTASHVTARIGLGVSVPGRARLGLPPVAGRGGPGPPPPGVAPDEYDAGPLRYMPYATRPLDGMSASLLMVRGDAAAWPGGRLGALPDAAPYLTRVCRVTPEQGRLDQHGRDVEGTWARRSAGMALFRSGGEEDAPPTRDDVVRAAMHVNTSAVHIM